GKTARDATNSVEAQKWYRMAAEQGNAEGELQLGSLLVTKGVADEFYNKIHGQSDDAETIATLKESMMWLRASAEQGNLDAQKSLGIFCPGVFKTVGGTPQEAYKWYRKAAEQGDADAEYHAGFLLEHGNGVEANSTEALQWYQKAAAQGNNSAKD